MKKVIVTIFITLCSFILCACRTKENNENIAENSITPVITQEAEPTATLIPTATVTPLPTETPVPAETAAPTATPVPEYEPFDGNFLGYVYYYEDERNKDWEQDVVYLAEIMLDKHPKLTDIYYMNTPELSYSNNAKDAVSTYDAELKEEFLKQINELVMKLPELDDTEIIYELQRILALFKDGHTYVNVPINAVFPVIYEMLLVNEEVRFYAVSVPEEYSWIQYSYLESINGVSTDEIINRFEEYISTDSKNWALHQISSFLYGGWIMGYDALQIIDIMEKNDTSAEFCFITEEGTEKKITLDLVIDALPEMRYGSFYFIPTLLYTNMENIYWSDYLNEETVYIRILNCYEDEELSLEEFNAQILDYINTLPEQGKIIMDFRENTGGYINFLDSETIAEKFNERKDISLYLLIDEGSYSAGVVTPYTLRQWVNNSLLVGAPAGQTPNMCANASDWKLPNSKYYVRISNQYMEFWPDYEYETLLPDITIYQTLEDYKQGIDTVLEAVLAMK